jgi:hypothetical protein
MDKKRKVYAPFSLTSEAGVAQTPVEGYIDVNQTIYPTVSTGTINENGKWVGVKNNDAEFIGFTKHEAVADGGETLSPDSNNFNHINMEGFSSLQFAVKVTRAGNYEIRAQVGPDTVRFANLQPVATGVTPRVTDNIGGGLENAFSTGNENVNIADVWHIYNVDKNRLANQQNLVIRIINAAGGTSDIEFAFRRLV